MTTAALIIAVILIIIGIGLIIWGAVMLERGTNGGTPSNGFFLVGGTAPGSGTNWGWALVVVGIIFLLIGVGLAFWGHHDHHDHVHKDVVTHTDVVHNDVHPYGVPIIGAPGVPMGVPGPYVTSPYAVPAY